jgi:hypothetical protein
MSFTIDSRSWGFSFALGIASIWLIGCGGQPENDPVEEQMALIGFEPGTRAHVMPLVSPQTVTDEATIQPAATARLRYFGGRVISKVSVVQVLYGSGTFLSNITSSSAPSMGSFYAQVTNSAYFDWLTEYNTTAAGGTNQTIGRGTFVKKVQITPAASRNGSTISDSSIQAELNAQIASGALPAPTANTVYMVNFPSGKAISLGGANSCVAGGFCAYHGTFRRGSSEVFYGVLPDMSPGSGCDAGCGNSTQFNNQTSVASHELVEAVTDAEVGLATVLGKPLAWYDPNNGEIGDICNGRQGTFGGGDGMTYTVQREWSNQSRACIVHK